MSQVKYICSHCGRKFEAEEKETLECPACFWSTSVKREEDALSEAAQEVNTSAPKQKKSPSLSLPTGLFPLIAIIAFATLLIVPLVTLFPKIKDRIIREDQIVIDAAGKKTSSDKSLSLQTPLGGLQGRSEEERLVLYNRLNLTADRPLSESEKGILENQTSFKSIITEKIPSRVWDLQGFEALTVEQEKLYKVPLPRSYKSKLEKIFQEKYLKGEEAFRAGELLRARDLWVESLAFPVYLNNVQRHRGVVLTMIRPFINDTLSKIGAINSTLMEREVREKEKEISEHYGELFKLIQSKSWPEAAAEVLTLEQKIDALENVASKQISAPQYSAAVFGQVDADIQAALVQILNTASPAVADVGPLRGDIQAKRRVIESFIAANVEAAQAKYEEAVAMIERRQWREAEKKLHEIVSPLALAEDAGRKLAILKKLNETNA